MEAREAVQQSFGQSWGDTLREAASNAVESPETDSDSVEVESTGEESQETVEASEKVTEGADDQPATESEPEAPTFNDDTEVDLGGDRKPVTLKELKDGYQRQSDYTKKTQELANQRKEIEAEREKLKPAADWMAHMESNPWLWGQINSALNEFNQTGVLPIEEVLADAQYGKYVNHLMAENQKLTQELDNLRGESEGLRLSSEMTKLRAELAAEYGDLVTDDYMQTLQERAKAEKIPFDTVREIADGQLAKKQLKSAPNVKAETRKAEAKAVQKMQEVRKQAPATPRAVAQVPAEGKADTSGGWGDYFKRLSGR